MNNKILGLILLLCSCSTAFASSSAFTTRLDDPNAIYLSAQEFGSVGDGVADDSAAIQSAIDKAENQREGIVFIPEGRYRLTRTIYVWPGVRVFGYGKTRPVFLLADNTPGFQKDIGVMVIFAGARVDESGKGPRVPFPPVGSVPANDKIADANPVSFYSAMSNIDFEVGEGNEAAVGIRFHVAQHSFLSHIDFHMGSALAALTEVGNQADNLRFYGGRYGILSDKTSPAWQFTLIDSVFDGQKIAAIREHELGLTLIRTTFRNLPTAVEIDPEYADHLWVKDSRFENISNAAVIISGEKNPLTKIGFENVVAQNTPVFALFRESDKKILAKGSTYHVRQFNYGLIIPTEGMTGTLGTIYDAEPLSKLPKPLAPALRLLPDTKTWVNAHSLGIKGDGTTDDTKAIQAAINKHKTLYFPSGQYVISDTITLKPNSIIIGLHPTKTQFDLVDSLPAYQGVGSPKAVILAPAGGANIISGFGVFAGGINPRAVAVLWKSGADSMVNDIRFLAGSGKGHVPFNNNRSADPDIHKRWDGQYPSLWVTDGGGGTFVDIWTPNTYAQSGMLISNTKTPGHIYELSAEHHVRNEIKFDNVENWDVNAAQTEEERGESPEALSLEISNSKNITIANYFGYRVTRSIAPFPAAVRVYNSENIRFRNVHVWAESGYGICDDNGCGTFLRVSKYPYENSIQNMTTHQEVREREFAVLDILAKPKAPTSGDSSAVVASDSKVEKLESGFFSIAGAAVDASGKLYFVDRHQQRIFGWSSMQGLSIERDNSLDPINLAFDKSGNLIVQSSYGPEGTMYSFRPGSKDNQITVLKTQDAKPHVNASAILPVNYWNNGEFKNHLNFTTMTYTTLAQMFALDVSTPKKREYVSEDGSVFIPAGRVFQQGPPDHAGWRFSNNLDTYGFIKAAANEDVYVSSESENKTYRAKAASDGTLTSLQVFAERGGESVAADGKGNVYVANGQIFVYGATGKQIAQIDVPERPLQLIFGGSDRNTLFILTHRTLYSVKIKS